jgi:hypothetical protein
MPRPFVERRRQPCDAVQIVDCHVAQGFNAE